ncbi:MAG: RHS repeat-associated core domain-containing protein [Candidatus Aphodosoma sp.]|nr:RHS repeat-associated core domain-containing protein [Candidatus Aphodosoma sp.]
MSISGGLDVSISSNSIKRDFIDINGDGYPDIVELKNDTVNIYLNKGYEIEEECSNLNSSITKISEDTSIYINTYLGITAGFTFCGTYKFNAGVHSTYSGSIESGTSSEFMDINGDGLPDYVISDNKNNRLLVYLNKTNKTNLLNKIINPTQEIIELDYTLSDVNQNKKERNWQLTQITEYQPSNYKNSQEKSFIEIEYSDPYYDNFERTYYGYSNVITEYNKEKFIIEKFENKNYLNAGEKTEDWLLDRQYKPIIRHKIGKEYKHATTGTIITNLCDDANIQEAQSGYWTYYYEGEDAPQIITYYSIEYDSIHNMIRYEDKGDTAVVGDEYVQIITYLPTTSKNQISLPKTEIIKDHTGKILRSSSINYDTNGSPKQIVFHNQTNNTDAITSFEYDNYGNIILLAKPENINGERAFTSYDYDPVCAMYPQKISDEFELNTEIYYDYRFGLPIKKIDVAGNTLLYKYDYMGRLTNVLMPNEITDNYPYTIKYDYYNVNHELKLQEDFLLENNIYQQQPSIGFATFKYTYVNKTQHDNLVSDTKYLTLYDAYGNVMQKKRQQQNGGKIEWICYENNILDNFMRPIIQSYPKKCTNNIYDYEQIGNHVISTNYDVLNRQTRITNPDSTKIEFDYGFKTDISGNIRLLTSLTKENDRTILQLRTPQGFDVEIRNGEDTITSLYYSAIGELLQTIDPEGYVTKYTYDNLGRIIERQQPDVGICQWTYDKAGNVTEYKNNTLINKGLSIKYDYSANRLMKVIYPQNISNNIDYEYDSCGRIHKRRDHCGTETFTYDALGNISKSERKIVLPTEANSYTFTTEFIYDSFGKIQTIIYPDGEQVSYNYKSGGILHSIEGNKNNVLHTYLEGREYDEFGRVILENNGNGVLSTYKYSDTRCWIEEIQRSTTNGVFQKLFYNYDAIGNILKIEQSASMQNGMGGRYINNYQYNNLDMLINSQGQGIDNPIHTYEVVLEYDKCGSIGLKRFSSENYNCNLIYGYDNKKQSHQPRVISDEENSPLQLFWDYNGNLSQINNCQTGVLSSHLWDEENRMQLMIHDDRCGYYGYDGNGKRVYKITGNIFQDNINASSMDTHFVFDDAIMYPNPYMTVTSQGYTKHYYVGNDIIATSMGTGGFDEVSTLTIKPLQSDHEEIIVKQFQDLLQERYPFGYELEEKQETKEIFTENVDINEKELLYLQYQCNPKQICQNTKTYVRTNMFLPIISVMRSNIGIENSVYYRHTDHLGTSNWITDTSGVAVQYLHYGPFGELLDEQSTTSYNERYRFTGKERDEESGYHYFGARYYTDHLGIWTSADPLLDKYPSISPYSYCSNNPLKFIDPDGRDQYTYDRKTKSFKLYKKTEDDFDQIGKLKRKIKEGEDPFKEEIKIPKGIIKNNVLSFKDNSVCIQIKNFTLREIQSMCMYFDRILGVEIAGVNINKDLGEFVILFPYKNNTIHSSLIFFVNDKEHILEMTFFHTHGHSLLEDYFLPSELDLKVKQIICKEYNTIKIKFVIFSDYEKDPIPY